MDTEVVIWSSKVHHSPPPPSDHAPWTTRPLYEQTEVNWIPQREPELLPVSNEIDFSSVPLFNRCASRFHCLNVV